MKCFRHIEPYADRPEQTSTLADKSETTNFPFPASQASRPNSGSTVQTAQPGPSEEPHHLRNFNATRSLPSSLALAGPETAKVSTRTFRGTLPPEEPRHKKQEASPPSPTLAGPKQETRVTTTHIRDYFGKFIIFFYIL